MLDEVKGQRIKDVVIQGNTITATRSDDSKVTTTGAEFDRGLISDLRSNNIRFDMNKNVTPGIYVVSIVQKGDPSSKHVIKVVKQ